MSWPMPGTPRKSIDHRGDPVLVVMAEPGASLAGELRRLLPALRKAVGDQRRVLVGFDRGGWSPALFAHRHTHGFDTLTWRKGPAPDTGITHTWAAADTTVDLPVADTGRTFSMRQITRTTQTRTGTHQVPPAHHTPPASPAPATGPRAALGPGTHHQAPPSCLFTRAPARGAGAHVRAVRRVPATAHG